MAISLSTEVIEAIRDKQSKKALATIDKHGIPHVVFKGSIDVDENGNIFFLELLESSQTNKNLTYSIWFDKTVAINVLTDQGKSYQIKGIPERVHIEGKLFEQKYKEVRARNPKSDLSGVWIIVPEDVREETYPVRLAEEEERHPIIGHLDRDVRK